MFELASGTENIRIPKFLLQTVVENIFKHGFSPEQFLSIFWNQHWKNKTACAACA